MLHFYTFKIIVTVVDGMMKGRRKPADFSRGLNVLRAGLNMHINTS